MTWMEKNKNFKFTLYFLCHHIYGISAAFEIILLVSCLLLSGAIFSLKMR